MIEKTEQDIMQNWTGDRNNPLVSICTITYNHELYIAEALNSFLMQETNFPFEIVVDEDCSTDKTAEIIKKYLEKFPTIIKANLREENIGAKSNFIANMKRTKGKYIALCEGDDYWTDPLKLQKQVNFLKENEDYNMVFHNSEIHHYQKNGITIKPFNTEDKSRDYTADEILGTWSIPTASVLYRNEAQHRYLDDNRSFPVGDTPLFIKCASLGKLYYMAETMSVYRRVPTGRMNSEYFQSAQIHLNFAKYLNKIYNDFSGHISKKTFEQQSASHHLWAAHKFKKNGNEKDFLKYLTLAMVEDAEYIYEKEIETKKKLIEKQKKRIKIKDQYLKQQQSKVNMLSKNRWYRFGQMSNKRKIWTIGKVVSKKIKLYGLLQPIVKLIKKY